MLELFCILVALAIALGAYHIKKLWDQIDIFKLKFRFTDETTTKQRKDLDSFIKGYHLEREVLLEKLNELSDELEHYRTAFDVFGSNYEEDRKALGQEVAILKEGLDEIKDSAVERNLEEARMFQGISNMMNYDPSQAARAVSEVRSDA